MNRFSLKELFYWWTFLAICFVVFGKLSTPLTGGIATLVLVQGAILAKKFYSSQVCFLYSIVCSFALILSEGIIDLGLTNPEFAILVVIAVPSAFIGGAVVAAAVVAADAGSQALFSSNVETRRS